MISWVAGFVWVMWQGICSSRGSANDRSHTRTASVARRPTAPRAGPRRSLAGQPRRRSGLEPRERQTEPGHVVREPPRPTPPDAAARRPGLAGVHLRPQERPGRQAHGAAAQLASVVRAHARHRRMPLRTAFEHETDHPRLDQLDPWLGVDPPRGFLAVAVSIGLAARGADRRALAGVQHAELDPGRVGHAPHRPPQRVDLAHDLPLAQPTDGGVAAHLPHLVGAEGDQGDRRPQARGGERGLDPRVAAADDDQAIRPVVSMVRRRVRVAALWRLQWRMAPFGRAAGPFNPRPEGASRRIPLKKSQSGSIGAPRAPEARGMHSWVFRNRERLRVIYGPPPIAPEAPRTGPAPLARPGPLRRRRPGGAPAELRRHAAHAAARRLARPAAPGTRAGVPTDSATFGDRGRVVGY